MALEIVVAIVVALGSLLVSGFTAIVSVLGWWFTHKSQQDLIEIQGEIKSDQFLNEVKIPRRISQLEQCQVWASEGHELALDFVGRRITDVQDEYRNTGSKEENHLRLDEMVGEINRWSLRATFFIELSRTEWDSKHGQNLMEQITTFSHFIVMLPLINSEEIREGVKTLLAGEGNVTTETLVDNYVLVARTTELYVNLELASL
jgi:hypothetical protein